MLNEALFPLLTGNAALTGALPGGIHQVSLPEGVCRPVMSYQTVSGISNPTFDTSGWQKVRIQFDAFGETRTQAANALDLLRQLLNGYRGVLNSGLFIQKAQLINPEPIDFSIEEYPRDFRCMSEYYVYFTFLN